MNIIQDVYQRARRANFIKFKKYDSGRMLQTKQQGVMKITGLGSLAND